MRYLKLCMAVGLILAVAGTGQAVTTTSVSGKATVYFAGQDAGDIAGFPYGDNIAAVLPLSVDITGFGGTIDVSATGLWTHGTSTPWSDADGYGSNYLSYQEYDDFGISLLNAPLNSLVGVFLTDSAPSPPPLPA